LLTAATAGTGAIGVAFAAVPFLASWQPSARAKALGAPVEVDASKLEPGQMLKVVWRGQPCSSCGGQGGLDAARQPRRHAGGSEVGRFDAAGLHQIAGARARNPEYWVGLAVCTHLGCSPLGAFEANNSFQVAGTDLGANWPGGFYCPCHGSKFDISGRVFKSMPAPKNLTVPPYAFVGKRCASSSALTTPRRA
jgi:ubiquinol-cytochrome c reductase iron-sulfur subunit